MIDEYVNTPKNEIPYLQGTRYSEQDKVEEYMAEVLGITMVEEMVRGIGSPLLSHYYESCKTEYMAKRYKENSRLTLEDINCCVEKSLQMYYQDPIRR